MYKEYGKGNAKTIVLLHGGGLSWWNYRRAAELLQKDFHILLPVLDGHAGSERPYTSIEDNAAEIIRLIDEKLNGYADLLGGLSLGGQTALEILSQRNNICGHALIESAAVIPDPLTNALTGPAFGSSYRLISKRSFAKLQFASLHMPDTLFEDYFRDTKGIAKADMIAFMKASTAYTVKETLKDTEAQVYLYCGEKENKRIRDSMKRIHEIIEGSTMRILPGLYHGEFSMNRAEEFADTVRKILEERK